MPSSGLKQDLDLDDRLLPDIHGVAAHAVLKPKYFWLWEMNGRNNLKFGCNRTVKYHSCVAVKKE
jgi:hypothetical protein